MNNKVPGFTDQEWELMKDYIDNSSKQPRQNLIELISHVDPSVAQLGMNSEPYFMLDRLQARCRMCLRSISPSSRKNIPSSKTPS